MKAQGIHAKVMHIIVHQRKTNEKMGYQPWLGAELLGVLSHTPKGCGFDPWSGYIPK